MHVRLGKKPAVHDSRTLRLSAFVERSALADLPGRVTWSAKVRDWPMYRNDEIGCCATAGPAHQVQAWTANDASREATPSVDDVLAEYRAISGWDGVPGSPTDTGCMMLDVMSRWRNRGLFGHRIGAFAAVDLHNADLLRFGIHRFGGVAIGVMLPDAVQGQDNSVPWQAPQRIPNFGEWSPGSWGGHYIIAVDYDADWITVVTWGGLKKMSRHFCDAYCDEAYVQFARDWIGPDNTAPNGIKALDLTRALGALG